MLNSLRSSSQKKGQNGNPGAKAETRGKEQSEAQDPLSGKIHYRGKIYVAGRVKAMNRDIMENVDAIHNAIAQNSKNWIMALGDGAKIIGPEKFVEEVRGEINRLMAQCSK